VSVGVRVTDWLLREVAAMRPVKRIVITPLLPTVTHATYFDVIVFAATTPPARLVAGQARKCAPRVHPHP